MILSIAKQIESMERLMLDWSKWFVLIQFQWAIGATNGDYGERVTVPKRTRKPLAKPVKCVNNFDHVVACICLLPS